MHSTRAQSTPPAPDVSIVLASYARPDRLRRCIEHVRANVSISHEICLVVGGPHDALYDDLADARNVRIQRETARQGCCAAYNTAFRLARGEFVIWLNDDAYPLPGAVDNAVRYLRSPADEYVGMVACYHNHPQPWNELHGYNADGEHWGVLHCRGYPYANFGVLRRGLLERLGYLDPGYYFCAWDPDLSLKVQNCARLRVIGLPAARVFHEEHFDARKQDDAGDVRTRDNERLFRKWHLPDKGAFPDPRPGYEALAQRLDALTIPAPAPVAVAH